MKSNAQLYQGFLSNCTVKEYCANHIDPYRIEIEHVGMNACIEAILKPAGISVEVLYLDRSEGGEVNSFSWPADERSDGCKLTPAIRLLYRP